MTNDPKFDTEDHPPFAPNVTSVERPVDSPRLDSKKKQSRFGTSMAVLLALAGFGLLAVLILGCSGGNPAILVLLLAMVGFLLLHYIVWGRSLSRSDVHTEDHPSPE
jgi:fatty acid desaturase